MPTYVYKFVDTGETIEVHQQITDDTLTQYPHPDTGTPMPVKKVFQPVGVTFKGSGFYKTDSRSGGKGSDAKPSTDAASSGDSNSSGGTGASSDSAPAKPDTASGSSTADSTASPTSKPTAKPTPST